MTRHAGRRGAQPRPDPVDEGAVPDRHEDLRDGRQGARLDRVGHLEGHRPGTGRDPIVLPVDQQERVVLVDVGRGGGPGGIEVLPCLDDGRAEGAHPRHLAPIGMPRREDDRLDAERAGGEGDALPEIAGRGDDDRATRADPPLPRQGLDRDPRPAALERADRVDGLDLDDHGDAEPVREARVDVLRAARERGVDPGVGSADRGRGQVGGSEHARSVGRRHVGGQRNARRNHRSVVSTADVNTCDTAFGLVAPSGKTYVSRCVAGAGKGLIHEFRGSMAVGGPVVHTASTNARQPCSGQRSSGQVAPSSRAGMPSRSTTSPGSNRVAERRGLDDGHPAASIDQCAEEGVRRRSGPAPLPRPEHRRGPERRAVDDDDGTVAGTAARRRARPRSRPRRRGCRGACRHPRDAA